MTAAKQPDLEKIKKLIANATNPREKAIYQALLDKAQQQLKLTQPPVEQKKELSQPPQEQSDKENKLSQPPQEQLQKQSDEEKKLSQPPQEQLQKQSDEEKTEKPSDSEDEKTEDPTSGAYFQAVGIIKGEVNFGEDGVNTVTIGNKTYPLFYIRQKMRAFEALKKQIKATGNHLQKLIVYPKVTHFPKRDQIHQIGFQLVGFDRGTSSEGIFSELNDMEFKFSGLWQFIPVCRTPCISVMRNYTKERLKYIKEADAIFKSRFMKASHLPLLWRDSPARPFRFNPKAEKDKQGYPPFVQVKARFLPQRDLFGFVEQLADPLEKAPRFLKVSKEDKAEAIKMKAKAQKTKTKTETKTETKTKTKTKSELPTSNQRL